MNNKPALKFSSKEFLPYFVAQLMGAGIDNLIKNIVTTLLVYGGIVKVAGTLSALDGALLVNMCAALFILPFLLFSGSSGVLSEHFEKSKYIFSLKIAEFGICLLAALALLTDSVGLMMASIFLLGLQSTVFGPTKYSYLPERFNKDDLTKANGWVEASTFLAILAGTLGAGALVYATKDPVTHSAVILALSGIGLAFSYFVPASNLESGKGALTLGALNPWLSTKESWKAARATESVYLSILGISGFWAIGSVVLSNLPVLAKEVFFLDETGLTFFLGLFSVGVAAGSIFAEKCSGKRLEIGLVPLAATLLAVAVFGMYSTALEAQGLNISLKEAVSLNTMLSDNTALSDSVVCFAIYLGLSGFAGGVYAVPLYTLVQSRGCTQNMGKIIAYNNFQNAVFMVVAALVCILMVQSGIEAVHTLLFAFVLNLICCAILFKKIPEFAFRLVVLLMARLIYKIDAKNHEIIPESGACVIVGNHVTWIDAFILSASCRRPPVYVMWWKLMTIPVVGWFFVKVCKAIPIAGKNENPAIYEAAFKSIAKAIEEGSLVCIFPEGALTWDGELAEFKNGVFKILQDNPAPLYAFGMSGVWGTFFSRKEKSFFSKLKSMRFKHSIGVHFEVVPSDIKEPVALRSFVLEQIENAEKLRG